MVIQQDPRLKTIILEQKTEKSRQDVSSCVCVFVVSGSVSIQTVSEGNQCDCSLSWDAHTC